MLFTGQGCQWPGMSRDLFVFLRFRQSFTYIVARFTDLKKPLLDVMWADANSEHAKLLDRTDFTQPALFALKVALLQLWKSWGLHPDIVLGHSVAELGAVYAAGILDLSSACRLVAARGRSMQALSSLDGKMAVLESGAAEATTAIVTLGLVGKVAIAALNTSTQSYLGTPALLRR